MKKSKKLKKAKRTTDTRWSFPITNLDQIDFDEVINDLSRQHPIALGIVKIKGVYDEAKYLYGMTEEYTKQQHKNMFFVAIQGKLITKADELDINLPFGEVLEIYQSKQGVVAACGEEQFHDYIEWAKKVRHTEIQGYLKASVKVILPTI